jgi:hypothetical protein
MFPSQSIRIGIAVVSACALMTEVMLTRLFSVVLWNHLAFLAVTLALFGSAAAALGYHLARDRWASSPDARWLALSSLALGGAILLCDWLVLAIPAGSGAEGLLPLLIILIASTAPFVASGFAVCAAMARWPEHVGSLYAWDLCGAAAGCLLSVPLLSWLGAPAALAAVALLAACGAPLLLLGSGFSLRNTAIGATVLAAAALGSVYVRASSPIPVSYAKGLFVSQLGLEYARWNSFSLVTVAPANGFRGWTTSPAWQGPIPEQKSVFIDMNAMTPMVRWDGGREAGAFALHDGTALVHHLRSRGANVCVIGAGGGKDVLAALSAGASHVTAVEINPLIVHDLMRGRYRTFTGGLYDRADVTAEVEDGRRFLGTTHESFDVIQLSMVDTSAATAAGAYSLAENSVYTVEAFGEFFSRLGDGGMLSVASVSLPGLAVGERLTWLARESLARAGKDPAAHIIVVTAPWLGIPQAVLHNVIVSQSPWLAEQVQLAREHAERLGMQIAYVLGEDAPGDAHGALLRSIVEMPSPELLLAARKLPLDISPTTDDRPFAFYQNRWPDLVRMLAARPPGHMFGNGGYFLARLCAVSLIAVLAFLGWPLLLARKKLLGGRGHPLWDVALFACLGLGFMAIEIASLQKVLVFLGRPTWALASVLFVLLTAGGLGSKVGQRLSSKLPRFVPAAAVAAYVSILWLSPLGGLVLRACAGWPDAGRLLVSGTLLAPAGFAMGMPLPWAVRAIALRAPARIPWLWGANAAASVAGSLLATLIALHAGISTTMLAGAILYAAAAALALRVCAALELRP